MALNMADLFEHAVDAFPERVALICGDRRLTYSELEDEANRLAYHLAAQGASPEQARAAIFQYGPTAGAIRELIAGSLREDENIDVPAESIVVTTNGQIPDSKATFRASPEFYQRRGGADPLRRLPDAVKKVPLIVLVNEGSASASQPCDKSFLPAPCRRGRRRRTTARSARHLRRSQSRTP